MRLSYDKLWKLLIDNKMKKGDLFRAAKLTETARRQLNHDEPVNLKVLMNICKIFHCNVGDVVNFYEEE
jgi:DNA-binding Xre family transcriptional regulator